MQKQVLNFYIQEKNSIVTQIGKSVVYQPKVNLKSGSDSVKWYPETLKKKK